MGGGKSSPEPPERIDPVKESQAQVDALVNSIPRTAQLGYEVLTNPQYGLTPTTRAYQQTRESVFPNESAVVNQLVQNVLRQLQSPTGITQEQQTAVDANRELAVSNTQRDLRNRANVGGNLYGGRSQYAEQQGTQQLRNQFSEQDIARQETSRLNNAQLALQIAQILFPGATLQPPQFINPVVNPNVQYQSNVWQRSQDIQNTQDNLNRQAALQSSLYQALGQVTGSVIGAYGAAKAGPSSVTNVNGGG